MKKISILLAILCISIAGFSFGNLYKHTNSQPNPSEIHTQITPPKLSPTPAVGTPVSLSIPKIHVLANIEQVGLDKQNRMDVPKQTYNAGWYKFGFKPGETGSAVL